MSNQTDAGRNSEKEAVLTRGILRHELEQFKRTSEKMLRNLEQREEEM